MFVSPALYLNALFLLLGDNSERSRNLVREFLDVVDKTGGKKEIMNDDDDLISVYRGLIRSVIQENFDQNDTSAAKRLLLKLSSNEVIKAHPVQRDLLTDVLTAQDPITAEQVDEYLKSIRNSVLSAEIDGHARKIFAKSRSLGDIQDPEIQAGEIANLKQMLDVSLRAIENRESTAQAKASESYVSMSDPDSVRRALNKYMERSVTGVIKTGLQGLNRALGERGGVGLGESVVFAAPSHHYKSGMLVSFMIWTIAYNKILVQSGKRALVYFVSLENEVHQNLMFVLKALYARVERKHVDIKAISTDELVDWIISYFKQFDIDLIIDRYNPHEFSYDKFIKRYNSFVEKNHQLVMFDLDYLSEAKGVDPGDTMSSQGQIQLIKENYIKFCNHAKQMGYAFITGHQLNRKATDTAATKRYAVKHFNESMVADSSDVFRTVDIVFYMFLENNVDDHKFLTMQNRKNRGNQDTKDSHKFFAYPFTEFGIEDDIHGAPGFVTDIDAFNITQGARDEDINEGALF